MKPFWQPACLKRQPALLGPRVIFLAGVLLSFCLLFANAEAVIQTASAHPFDYQLDITHSNQAILQITYKISQENFLEVLKNRKTPSSIKNHLHAVNLNISIKHIQSVKPRSSPGYLFQGSLQQIYLLIDLPPPCI
jgi:P2-related tail formation protein